MIEPMAANLFQPQRRQPGGRRCAPPAILTQCHRRKLAPVDANIGGQFGRRRRRRHRYSCERFTICVYLLTRVLLIWGIVATSLLIARL